MKTKSLFMPTLAALVSALPLLAADVREGLVAYWPLNTGVGDGPFVTPEVIGGKDMVGLFKTTGDIAPGKFGNCIQFYGSVIDYLAFTNTPGADTGLPVANNGSWTWALWVNGATGQVNQTTYFCEASSLNSSGNPRFAMEGNGTDKTRYFIRDNSGTVLNQVVGSKPSLDGT